MNYYWSYPECKIIIRYSDSGVSGLISTKEETRDIPKARIFYEEEKDQVKEICFECYDVMAEMGVPLDTLRLFAANCFDPDWLYIEGSLSETPEEIWDRILEKEKVLDTLLAEGVVLKNPVPLDSPVEAPVEVTAVEETGQMLLF